MNQNLTHEKNHICNEFTNMHKKITEENKNYNDTIDIFLVHLVGVKKAMQLLKNFYNLTNLSSLFEQFQNHVKTHETVLMAQTANEIKNVVDVVMQKIDTERSLEKEYIQEAVQKHFKKRGKKNMLEMKKNGNSNNTQMDVQIMLKIYKILNNLLDSMQNTTVFFTNYHNSIEIYYNKKLEDLNKLENRTETKFNETYEKITENTSKIKDDESKINACIGKAHSESECDPIKRKAKELLGEVQEFLEILNEILQEFNKA